MFERFSQDARQVIMLSQEEVRTLGHNWVGTEHALLGLLRMDELKPAGLLGGARIADLEPARAEVAKICPPGKSTGGHIPFTPRMKTVLETGRRLTVTDKPGWISVLAPVSDSDGDIVGLVEAVGNTRPDPNENVK